MRNILLTIAIVFGVYFSSCQSNQAPSNPNEHKIVVSEVLQANEYTYLHGTDNDKDVWMAVPKMDATVGETYYYNGGFPMTNFQSKDLNRTFAEVLFVDVVSKTPIVQNNQQQQAANPHGNNVPNTGNITDAQKPKVEKSDVKVEHSNGEISISELFKNKDSYNGKKVKVKGKVVKFSPEIMSKNWIHLQDGTDFDGKFDLTITTTSTDVKVDDIVTLEGTLTTNKDFGFGYFYEVLIEDASITK